MRTAAGEAEKMVIELCSRISRREKWRIKAFLVRRGFKYFSVCSETYRLAAKDLLSYVPTGAYLFSLPDITKNYDW